MTIFRSEYRLTNLDTGRVIKTEWITAETAAYGNGINAAQGLRLVWLARSLPKPQAIEPLKPSPQVFRRGYWWNE